MDKALKANIKELIKSKRGFEFESFISELNLIQYGSDGFQPTRERKDDGAEGLILSTKTIIAAYGPDAFDERKFNKKVNDDFEDYLNKWSSDNPNWIMHYNNALAPTQLRVSNDLEKIAIDRGILTNHISIKGIDQIMHMIENEFSSIQQRAVAKLLGVPRELIVFDHVRNIIQDLISGHGIEQEVPEYKLEVDIEEKIKLNYTDSDVNHALEEYEDLNADGTLKKIWGILSTFQTEEINILKLRIKREFNNENGSFKEKLNTLTNKYALKYSNDDDDFFNYYIRSLLVYCFEQCMIGKKTSSES
ncbi:hypothetical protein V1387_08825 [Allomuricauda taeanensis]|uniref:hypothetical protein n=1 Tax=Flagellimonas taeanensis TaxID=1005926 RepID=UPI002E7C2945|nr:hypothetical protein [Allomuricauda taeanensis]MEE1962784.1 hypothetical protein [Allomuricauda taeanensis]